MAALGKLRILRQEAIARVHTVTTSLGRHPQHLINRKIGTYRTLPGDLPGFSGVTGMQCQAINGGVDRDRFQPEFGCGARDPDRNLATIGDEDTFEHI